MVNIACLISNGYDILLLEQSDPPEKNSYILPESSAESIEAAQQIIAERLSKKSIYFGFDKILYATEEELPSQVLYLCHTLQWTNLSENSVYKWFKVSELACDSISSAFQEISDAANDYLKRRARVVSEIRLKLENFYNQSQVRIDIGEQFDRIIFWLRHPKIYVPFCLEVEYAIKRDQTVDFHIRWRASRQYAPGDKSDLYMLFTETMALLLKLFNAPVFVSTYNYLGTEPEINGAEIIFEGHNYTGSIAEAEFAEKLLASFMFFNFILDVHGMFFGTISNALADKKNHSIIEYLGARSNYVIRKESSCYYNSNIGYISLFNNYYDCRYLVEPYSYELLTGVTGALLFSSFSNEALHTNYIDRETLDIVNEVVENFSIKQYTLISQNNRLYLLSGNTIWIFTGDFHHSNVIEEEKLIFDGQAKENALLHVNRNFEWIFPVAPGRFEQLVADIIEYQQPDSTVRLVGRTNDPDGGRDIIVRRRQGEKHILMICQCKAYQSSVNKTHVPDIRDTLDYYEATGFLLAVTSDVTVPLIDHLMSLSKKYDVNWWTKREIFKMLRQYPSIADAYQDIIRVVDD